MKDGIVVIKDFCSPEEVSELHEAGKKMCHEAPKKDRTIFSSAANSSHVRNHCFIIIISPYLTVSKLFFRPPPITS
jgi:hypothetical protein